MINNAGESRKIIHLQATCWEDDNAITDKSHFEDLDKIVKHIKKHRDNSKPEWAARPPTPIIVHCSAGIGRTGTLTAIYAIIESVEWLHKNAGSLSADESMGALEDIQAIEADYPLMRKPRISVFGTVRRMRE